MNKWKNDEWTNEWRNKKINDRGTCKEMNEQWIATFFDQIQVIHDVRTTKHFSCIS